VRGATRCSALEGVVHAAIVDDPAQLLDPQWWSRSWRSSPRWSLVRYVPLVTRLASIGGTSSSNAACRRRS
jgi:hypothetical protein